MSFRNLIVVVLGLLWASPDSAPATDLETLMALRSNQELTADDLKVIDDYLQARLAEFDANPTDLKAAKRFKQGLVQLYRSAQNSPAFQRSFAERLSARLAQELATSQGPRGWHLVHTLRGIQDSSTIQALQAAARSPDAAVRALAVTGIHELHGSIEHDDAALSQTIQWLAEFGAREPQGSVLTAVYYAFAFKTNQDEQAQALLSILKARLNAFQQGQINHAPAELAAFERLTELHGTLGDGGRRELLQLLAKLLAHYAHRFCYSDLSSDARENLQRLMFLAERLISQLTAINIEDGGVAAAAGLAGGDRYTVVVQRLQAWVGSRDEAGKLNGATWQVPRGGGLPGCDFSAPLPTPADAGSDSE